MMNKYPILMNLQQAIKKAAQTLYNTGQEVEAKKWQGIESPKNTLEALFVNIHARMTEDEDELIKLTKPNLPWAPAHFKERVLGLPLNPGETYKIWPYYGRDLDMRPGAQFSHTYMERFWPKYAHVKPHVNTWEDLEFSKQRHAELEGIRDTYGDLNGVIKQLVEDPHTRQAYLPIWFPEDTGAIDRRVPCTLGYHFIYRNGYLHLTYHIRSCDLVRHLQDDVYLAVKLAKYVAHYVKNGWQDKTPTKKVGKILLGQFNMHIGSLHTFITEKNRIKTQFEL